DPLRGLNPARGGERQVHQDDVGRRLHGAIDGGARVVRLGDDREVGLTTEDIGDAHPEQGVIVDDEDLRDVVGGAPVRAATSALGPAVFHRHELFSPPVAGPVGIASRTTVPPSGRDRTSNRAPTSSARSRMNWSPKLRRPRAATVSMSKPRPSSRTSSTQSGPSRRVATTTWLARPGSPMSSRPSWPPATTPSS